VTHDVLMQHSWWDIQKQHEMHHNIQRPSSECLWL